MPQRFVADLPDLHEPWDVPSHRVVAVPLLDEPLTLPELTRALARAGIRRESVYRVVRRLRLRGALLPLEPTRGETVRIASNEVARLTAAIAAEKTLRPTALTPDSRGEPREPSADAGYVQDGDIVLEVEVTPGLTDEFAAALERVARAHRSLWGMVRHGEGGDYLLVAPAGTTDVLALADELEAAGTVLRRSQVSTPMNANALIAHARRRRNARAQRTNQRD